MNCEETTDLLAERLSGQLADDEARRLDAHLAACPACRAEADAVTELWNDMDIEEIPVPSQRMRTRFHAALAAYDERRRSSTIERALQWVLPQRPMRQLGAAVAMLVAGVFIGRGLQTPVGDEISDLREDMRIVSIALLGHQSATERLRGVERLQSVPASNVVTDALLDVVRNDSSVNVRLAAAEALGAQLARPDVGAALTDAFNLETTPLMQVTLASMLLRNDVTGSRATVQRFIERDEVDATVRDYLQAVMESTEQTGPQDQFL